MRFLISILIFIFIDSTLAFAYVDQTFPVSQNYKTELFDLGVVDHSDEFDLKYFNSSPGANNRILDQLQIEEIDFQGIQDLVIQKHQQFLFKNFVKSILHHHLIDTIQFEGIPELSE